tara:strand:- start:2152 stop:3393 length:1242 start_codon:yes stop_codon:yes gene_type:complete
MVHAYEKEPGIVSLRKQPGDKIIEFGTLKQSRFSNKNRVSPNALTLISGILGKVYDPEGIRNKKYFNFIKHNSFFNDLQESLFSSNYIIFGRDNAEKLQWEKIASRIDGINLDASMEPDIDSDLPTGDQEFYRYDEICELLKNIVVTKSIPDKCFIRIRKWEVLIDEDKRNGIKKISDCNKPIIGHTYYLYYSEMTGLRTWNNECFKDFKLLDEGWFLDDIIRGPHKNNISKISQLYDDSKIDYASFKTLLSSNNYVRQHTFFKPRASGYRIKDNTVDGTKDYDYIEPEIYFTIEYSSKTYKPGRYTGMNSRFLTRKCEPDFKSKDGFLPGEQAITEFPHSHILRRKYATVTLVKGGKNKRKVSRVNKKDVLGKQRNIYKFVGDKKEYIKYNNKYVLLKKYKEMQKTKTKSKK